MSRLAFLHEAPEKPSKQHHHDTASTKEHLEHLTRTLVEAHADIDQPGNVAFFRSVSAPRLRFYMPEDRMFESTSGTVTLESYLASIVEYKGRHDAWAYDVWNVTGMVADDGETAEVWLSMTGNHPEKGRHTRREIVQKMTWRLRNGQWTWCACDAVFGPARFN